jgi:hypothetical protein
MDIERLAKKSEGESSLLSGSSLMIKCRFRIRTRPQAPLPVPLRDPETAYGTTPAHPQDPPS